jgi:hypothetical protein
MSPGISAVDDRAAVGPGGGSFGHDTQGAHGPAVDLRELEAEVLSRNPNRRGKHPFQEYWERVVREAGVPDAHETRRMASVICGEVAALPFTPDDETPVPVPGSQKKTTEFEQQIERTALSAEKTLDSKMVWTASALKIARKALELRKRDPDGSRGIAWVNDPLPGEERIAAPLPSSFQPAGTDPGEDEV